MNFDVDESAAALVGVATQVFGGATDHARLARVEASAERMDRDLWARLAESDLLGLAIPEGHGGLGFGMLELALVLERQGRSVAPVPLLPTLVLGALPIANFGSTRLAAEHLRAVALGQRILTGAFATAAGADHSGTAVRMVDVGTGWRLTGSAGAVPAMAVADHVLVPAETADGSATVFIIDRGRVGLDVTLSDTTNRELHGELTLDDVAVTAADAVGAVGVGADVVAWTLDRARVAASATVVGCAAEATRLAAEYTSEREQFGRPLSTNQAVAQRAADCFIDTEAIRLTTLQAAWALDAGRPAAELVAVAAWWAAEAGQRVVHATQHLHGGMGADVEYPVHRYFLWVTQLATSYGSAGHHLAGLGGAIAARAKSLAAS